MKTANSVYGLTTVDLSFKEAHNENGIPICCMTCSKWSFRSGRTCGDSVYTVPCKDWEISEYYATSKEVNDEPIFSEAHGESQAR